MCLGRYLYSKKSICLKMNSCLILKNPTNCYINVTQIAILQNLFYACQLKLQVVLYLPHFLDLIKCVCIDYKSKLSVLLTHDAFISLWKNHLWFLRFSEKFYKIILNLSFHLLHLMAAPLIKIYISVHMMIN